MKKVTYYTLIFNNLYSFVEITEELLELCKVSFFEYQKQLN
jgi:hypothetical protein